MALVEAYENMDVKVEKTKEEIMAERKAKKAAKKQGKQVTQKAETAVTDPVQPVSVEAPPVEVQDAIQTPNAGKTEKSREAVLKEREMKKLAKQSKVKKDHPSIMEKTPTPLAPAPICETMSTASTISAGEMDSFGADGSICEPKNALNASIGSASDMITFNVVKKTLTKAERRAVQEAQRAAKAAAQTEKEKQMASMQKKPTKIPSEPAKSANPFPAKVIQPKETHPVLHRVKLFNHLYTEKRDLNVPVNSNIIHPAIIRLGIQYANGIIVGGNARCVAFLKAIKELVVDYITPEQQEYNRGLEALLSASVEYLRDCRPLSVSMINALRYIKWQITRLDVEDDDAMVSNRRYPRNLTNFLPHTETGTSFGRR